MVSNFAKRYSVAEMVLLLLFAAGLGGAYLIIKSHDFIGLSEPIKLGFTNLSISVPTGKGWETNPVWQYDNQDGYNLVSNFSAARHISAVVRCSYLLAAGGDNPEQLIEQELAQGQAYRVSSGSLGTDVELFWAEIRYPSITDNTYIGFARLQAGRLLKIEVATAEEAGFARRIFHKVASSIIYSPDPLLENGNRFIENIRADGIKNLLNITPETHTERCYIATDKLGRKFGYLIDTFGTAAAEDGVEQIQCERLIHTDKDQIAALFKCNNTFDKFTWQTRHELSSRKQRQWIFETEFSDGRLVSSDLFSPKDNIRRPARWAIPEILIDEIAARFGQLGTDAAVIDVILANGAVVPVKISTAKTNPSENNDVSGIIRIDFLHITGIHEVLYLDGQDKIIRKEEYRDKIYVWRQSSRKQIMELFDPNSDTGEAAI